VTTALVAGGAMMMVVVMMMMMMICRVAPFTFHGGSGDVAAVIIDIGYLFGAGGLFLFASVGQREQSSVESCDHYLSNQYQLPGVDVRY